MKFWNNFLRLCNNAKKAPNAVAKEIGISSAAIAAWKSKPDRVPQDRMLLKIADYFGVPVETLKGNEALELAGIPVINEKNRYSEPKRTNLGQKENAPGEMILTESENMLLELFRSLPPDKQELVVQTVKAFADSQK